MNCICYLKFNKSILFFFLFTLLLISVSAGDDLSAPANLIQNDHTQIVPEDIPIIKQVPIILENSQPHKTPNMQEQNSLVERAVGFIEPSSKELNHNSSSFLKNTDFPQDCLLGKWEYHCVSSDMREWNDIWYIIEKSDDGRYAVGANGVLVYEGGSSYSHHWNLWMDDTLTLTDCDHMEGTNNFGHHVWVDREHLTVNTISPSSGNRGEIIDFTITGGFLCGVEIVQLTRTDSLPITPEYTFTTYDGINGVIVGYFTIPETAKNGTWKVTITQWLDVNNDLTFTIGNPFSIDTINPNTGENTSPIDVIIEGEGFTQGSIIALVNKTQSIFSEKEKELITPTRINATFNLTNVESGTYSLYIYNPEGQEAVLNDAFTVTSPQKIPVVLVHGYTASRDDWVNVKKKFEDNDIPIWDFDYSQYNRGLPDLLANDLRDYIFEKRKETKYWGPIDIYCHSMGALISRYYMEYLGGSPLVRQWIGIAPVVHGSAMADNSNGKYPLYATYLILGSIFTHQWDFAINELATTSNTVRALDEKIELGLPDNVKYRIITGYNPSRSPDFFPAFAGLTLEKKGSSYSWTYSGDFIVAFEQSYIKNKDFDVLPFNPEQTANSPKAYMHNNLPKNSEVIDLLWKYYNDPTIPSHNNTPPDLAATGKSIKPTLLPYSQLTKEFVKKIIVKKFHIPTIIVDLIDDALPQTEKNSSDLNITDKLKIYLTDDNGQIIHLNSTDIDVFEESSDKIYFTLKKGINTNYTITLNPVNPPIEGYSGNITVIEFTDTSESLPEITNLHNTTYLPDKITWEWTDPEYSSSTDVLVSLNEGPLDQIPIGTQTYTAENLQPISEYTLCGRIKLQDGTIVDTKICNDAWTSPTAVPTTIPTTIPTGTPTPNPIESDFNASIQSGTAPLTVQFTDASTGSPTSWSWTFGDGGTSTEKNPSYIYTNIGTYTVSLTASTVYNSDTEIKPGYITVTSSNDRYDLMLHPGWNFISIPRKLSDGLDTPRWLDQYIDPQAHSMWTYAGDTSSWVHVMADDPLRPLEGYWLWTSEETMVPFILAGRGENSPTKNLYTGWNAIGFTATEPIPASETLFSVANSWLYILGFDAFHQTFETTIIKGGTGEFADTRLMNPGQGYWLYMTENGMLHALTG